MSVPLSRLSIFQNVSPQELTAFEARARRADYVAGDEVFVQGDPADYALLVLQGRLIVSVVTDDGGQRDIAEIGPGELAGEGALFRPNVPRNASVRAERGSHCLVLDSAMFDRNDELAKALELYLLETLSQRIRVSTESLEVLWDEAIAPPVPSIRDRLATWLGIQD